MIYELEKEPSLILQNLSISESGQMGSFAAQSRLVRICSSNWLLGVKPRDLSQAQKKKITIAKIEQKSGLTTVKEGH